MARASSDLSQVRLVFAMLPITIANIGMLAIVFTVLIIIDPILGLVASLAVPALFGSANRFAGKIINISSIGGRKGGGGRSAYRVTKAALISLTESVAAEVKRYGIDVNCICPGGVDTEGYREAFGSRGREENPKLMRPEEIAELAVFLASDASSAVTGTAIDAFGATNPLFR